MTTIQQPDLQLRTLHLYGELLCRRTDWRGQLVIAAYPGAAQSGLAAAASIAGAASLTVDSDSLTMKAHFRDGAYDFVVNTLDEALRALKNEVRRKRSIAVGLMADPRLILVDSIQRGLAVRVAVTDQTLQELNMAAALLSPDGCLLELQGAETASPELQRWLEQHQWSPTLLTASVLQEAAFAATLQDDEVRWNWFRSLFRHQRSAARGDRWMWLRTSEREAHRTL